MNELQVLTHNGARVLTTQQLAEVYETDVKNIQMNFKRNSTRFIECKHFYTLKGAELKTFKNLPTMSGLVDSRTPQLILWTEKGADRHCKILDTDKAWEQFDNLEETYFKVKEHVKETISTEDALIQTLQITKQIRLTAERAESIAVEVKQEISGIRDVITLSPSNWRKGTSTIITRIAQKLGGNEYIQTVREESYKYLEERAHVALGIRLSNKRKAMAAEGTCKSKRDKLNKLDIINEDPKVLECYLAIVKEMAIKYGVTVTASV